VKHEALVQGIDMEMAVGGEYRLLDEPKSYNFDTLPDCFSLNPRVWVSRVRMSRPNKPNSMSTFVLY